MRSDCKAALVTLIAIFALGVIGVGSASAALPELSPAPSEASPVTFSNKDVHGSSFTFPKNETIFECGETSTAGEFINPKEIRNTVITFGKCELRSGQNKWECGNNGSRTTITSEKLSGVLGYLNAAKKEVGLMFGSEYKKKPLEQKPTWAAKVVCKGVVTEEFIMKGELISPITPVNKKVTGGEHFALVNRQSEGKQSITKFEGGVEGQQLSAFFSNTFEPLLGIDNTFELSHFKQGKFEIGVELKA